jgi:hypothetical protein
MSDFLTNLALRSSRSADLIKPRLPSLFEPSRPATNLLAKSEFAPLEHFQETTDDVLRPSDSPQVRGSSLGPIESPSTRQAATPPSVTQQTRPSLEPMTTNGAFAGKLQAPLLARPLTTSDASAVMPQSPRVAEPAQSSQRSHDHLADSNQPTNRDTREGFESPSFPTLVTGNLLSKNQPDGPTLQPSAATIAANRRAVDLMPVARVEARSNESKSKFSSSQSTPSEPSIQVTIGRIEVRATQQQPPAQKDRSASPVMSLDEYLRKKRAGA